MDLSKFMSVLPDYKIGFWLSVQTEGMIGLSRDMDNACNLLGITPPDREEMGAIFYQCCVDLYTAWDTRDQGKPIGEKLLIFINVMHLVSPLPFLLPGATACLLTNGGNRGTRLTWRNTGRQRSSYILKWVARYDTKTQESMSIANRTSILQMIEMKIILVSTRSGSSSSRDPRTQTTRMRSSMPNI